MLQAEIYGLQSYHGKNTYDASAVVYDNDDRAIIKLMVFAKETEQQAIDECKSLCMRLGYQIKISVKENK